LPNKLRSQSDLVAAQEVEIAGHMPPNPLSKTVHHDQPPGKTDQRSYVRIHALIWPW
jgi:hypothetical protein